MPNVTQATRDKWAILIDRLYYATLANRVTWENSQQFANAFQIGIKDRWLHLSLGEGEFGPLAMLRICDDSGRLVETFTDEDILDGNGSPRGYWQVMSDLFSIVSRKVSGAEEIVDELIESLPPAPKPERKSVSELDDDIPF